MPHQGAVGDSQVPAGTGGLTGGGNLEGRRILLVEDQFLIALELEQVLQKAGCIVTGPVARLQPALDLARTEAFDFAVLDVNLFGEKVYPVAEMLESRGIPFVLATGYGPSAVPEDRPDWLVVPKPYDALKVRDLIVKVLAA